MQRLSSYRRVSVETKISPRQPASKQDRMPNNIDKKNFPAIPNDDCILYRSLNILNLGFDGLWNLIEAYEGSIQILR